MELAEDFNFNIITPRPFVLSEQPKQYLEEMKDEAMDKVITWEKRSNSLFESYFRGADSWRIKPYSGAKKSDSKTWFDSKSGETHRAVETLATVWHRMLTASDPYLEGVAMGLNQNGMPITEEEIYATEGVLLEQHKYSRYKKKLLNFLRSLSLMGTSIVEAPFVSLPYGFGRKTMEYTDFVPRSMLLTGFDTSVFDIMDSDFIFTIDFVSKWMLRNQASLSTDHWDIETVEKHISESKNSLLNATGQSYNRLQQSRARAGYYDEESNVFENLNYHGRLEVNPVIEAYAESIGLEDDPKYVDWSIGILNGMEVAKFHMTQYGDWRTRFKIATYKDFENEPRGYGVAQIGRKLQRNMDVLESMTDDRLMFDVLNMMKIGKYSGYDAKQFVAEPLKMIELEDVNQLVPLVGDPRVLQQALVMIGLRREDFRNIVGAQTNLQAQKTDSSATEAAIAQTEAIRSAGVHAEIIGETIRDFFEIQHINNLNYLDSPIWVAMTGSQKPMLVDKNKLPSNIGFNVKIVTDKDFRPERQKNLLQILQIVTSIRNFVPSSINAIKPIFEEIFRNSGLNPRLLSQPIPVMDQIEKQMSQIQNGGGLANQVQGEVADEMAGSTQMQSTPVGLVPTSNVQTPEVSA